MDEKVLAKNTSANLAHLCTESEIEGRKGREEEGAGSTAARTAHRLFTTAHTGQVHDLALLHCIV